ncbi:type III-A CRISPR-associated protein Csm2 [Desulfolucanica intricata]|uniref:type III-A CRISPR-associated protein Csm2 n=1 Tax=Desulfolucanica intricata TaxID=1285191 RepID=UPI000833B392|nr:type III-A CRISPR-associated protein Csm2 [Desulfolucanica intricata]
MAGMRNPRSGGNQRDNRVVDSIVSNINKLNQLADLSVDDLVKHAEDMGRFLTQINLKTNQIRKFLDAVKKVESEGGTGKFNRTEVKLLKPKLAYAAGRQNEVKPLMSVLDPCIDRVNTKEDFKQFARLVEGIVAYHKFYGGRD